MSKAISDFIVYFSEDAPDRAHLRDSIETWKRENNSNAELVELNAYRSSDFADEVKRKITSATEASKSRKDVRVALITNLHSVDRLGEDSYIMHEGRMVRKSNYENIASNGVLDVLKGLQGFLNKTKKKVTSFFAFRSMWSEKMAKFIGEYPVRPIAKDTLDRFDFDYEGPRDENFGYANILGKFYDIARRIPASINFIPKSPESIERKKLFDLLDTAFSRPLTLQAAV